MSEFGRRVGFVVLLAIQFCAEQWVLADVRLPALFSDHMVLRQGCANPVWGWADRGETIVVRVAEQQHSAVADDQGRWSVLLDPLPPGGPLTLMLAGKNKIEVRDVLVGEVWLCSGQSNMEWPVNQSKDADLERLSAKYDRIRLLSVPQLGAQEPRTDFDGAWQVCSPQTVGSFSAVAYFFGRRLHQVLGLPIGLIDNSWGGSACEAWVSLERLQGDPRYGALLRYWRDLEQEWTTLRTTTSLDDRQRARFGQLELLMTGNARPANLYNGVLKPVMGYGISGVIWYQGESNAERAMQYRHLFPLMIQNWRDQWQQGDFPFYWVQLADFQLESDQPQESAWAELREAQTMTMTQLPHTGEAVIVNLGEGSDIHPKDKQGVAERLARWALAQDYGLDIPCHSPLYKSSEHKENKVLVTFDHVGGGLTTFDIPDPVGFAVAGADRTFHFAKARLLSRDTIEVWSDAVPDPVAVRYAWADNPVCNVQSLEGLPLTPFRTDDWPGITAKAD
jgi:sialate O-acetylesterase